MDKWLKRASAAILCGSSVNGKLITSTKKKRRPHKHVTSSRVAKVDSWVVLTIPQVKISLKAHVTGGGDKGLLELVWRGCGGTAGTGTLGTTGPEDMFNCFRFSKCSTDYGPDVGYVHKQGSLWSWLGCFSFISLTMAWYPVYENPAASFFVFCTTVDLHSAIST